MADSLNQPGADGAGGRPEEGGERGAEQVCIAMRPAGETGSLASQTSQCSKLLHFSDGTLSVDEHDQITAVDARPVAAQNKVGLRHRRWRLLQPLQTPAVDQLVQFGSSVGRHTMKVVDYVGGGVASVLGITSPKYASEIGQLEQREQTEERRQQKLAGEMRGWTGDQPNLAENQI